MTLQKDLFLQSEGHAWLRRNLDFEARAPLFKSHHHLAGIQSRKMDNKSIFLWHPAYTLASHERFHHVTRRWTDLPDEWVSLACLRKCRLRP